MMRRARGGPPRRWRSALVVGLLVASIVMVALLALQAAFAYAFHRRVAESVLLDYARVVADEFIRRTSAEVGYRGYFSVVGALQNEMGGNADPELPEPDALVGASDGRGRPARELIRTLFLIDPKAGTLRQKGAPLDEPTRRMLVESVVEALSREGGAGDPISVIHDSSSETLRTFIYTALAPPEGRGPLLAGFEVNFDAMGPWLQRVADGGPLLPASLGDGELSNDLLSIRLNLEGGRTIFASGADPEPYLSAYTPFGDTYSGVFQGMTVLTSIPNAAAPKLVIGGLPRSQLPALLGLLLLTVGLLVAAIHQLRRERSLARMRSDFVSRVSHELRTPLTQIRMFAETLILGRARTVEERRRSLEIVDQEARRLSHLVENILQFSRGDRGAIRLAPRPVEMSALVLDVTEKFQPVARSRQATVVALLEGETVCLVDDDAMRQVMLNLLDNAVKYGPTGQEVRFGLEEDGRNARIWIDDQGPGIPQRERERVWIRWQRLERDEKAALAGTGIGLTVVRDLVALQGGSAWVEDGQRGGARFVVELPIMAGEPAGSKRVQREAGRRSA